MRLSVVKNNDFNGNESLEITINNGVKFYVSNNNHTPEDNTLSENFIDCYNIPDLLQMAWLAGRKGDDEFIIDVESEGEDF